MILTVSDLLAFAASEARIERIDYFDPHYPRAEEVRAWQTDCRRRSAQRLRVMRRFPARTRSEETLVPGRYYGTRLIITDTAINYIPGQYAPVEVWRAVEDYFAQTNPTA